MNCAERGCAIGHDALELSTNNGGQCPHCGHPLRVVMEAGDALRLVTEASRVGELVQSHNEGLAALEEATAKVDSLTAERDALAAKLAAITPAAP